MKPLEITGMSLRPELRFSLLVLSLSIPVLLTACGGGGGGGTKNEDTTVQPSPTGKLNDTGVTGCADNTNNRLSCPQANFPGQDAEFGRDADTNGDSDGRAGFSFTKIGKDGKALAIQNKDWSDAGSETEGTQWSCVKDNVTGLIWETKTKDGGLHDYSWNYTWYNPNATTNGGGDGQQNGGTCGATSQCDTTGFVQKVNSDGWCGAKDWRMPTLSELLSIVDYEVDPAVPPAGAFTPSYFPNTQNLSYWASSPFSDGGATYAWTVNFNYGTRKEEDKTFPFYARLVRGTP